MTLFNQPKAFVKVFSPNNSETGPVLELRYILVDSSNVVQPGPVDTWYTVYMPFVYADNSLTLQLKIQTYLLTYTGLLNLNVILLP